MNKCSNIMSKDLSCCIPESSIDQVAEVMKDTNVGCLPVVKDFHDKQVIGIITDRDLVIRVIGERRNPGQTLTAQVMTKHPIICSADAEIDEAVALMIKHQIRRLPIVDADHKLVGIITDSDIATKLDEPSITVRLVKAVASPTVLS